MTTYYEIAFMNDSVTRQNFDAQSSPLDLSVRVDLRGNWSAYLNGVGVYEIRVFYSGSDSFPFLIHGSASQGTNLVVHTVVAESNYGSVCRWTVNQNKIDWVFGDPPEGIQAKANWEFNPPDQGPPVKVKVVLKRQT